MIPKRFVSECYRCSGEPTAADSSVHCNCSSSPAANPAASAAEKLEHWRKFQLLCRMKLAWYLQKFFETPRWTALFCWSWKTGGGRCGLPGFTTRCKAMPHYCHLWGAWTYKTTASPLSVLSFAIDESYSMQKPIIALEDCSRFFVLPYWASRFVSLLCKRYLANNERCSLP